MRRTIYIIYTIYSTYIQKNWKVPDSSRINMKSRNRGLCDLRNYKIHIIYSIYYSAVYTQTLPNRDYLGVPLIFILYTMYTRSSCWSSRCIYIYMSGIKLKRGILFHTVVRSCRLVVVQCVTGGKRDSSHSIVWAHHVYRFSYQV